MKMFVNGDIVFFFVAYMENSKLTEIIVNVKIYNGSIKIFSIYCKYRYLFITG